MRYINYNGKIVEAFTPVIAAGNRGFKYGDGVFETLKYKQGKLVLFHEHMARLWKGMQLFKMQVPVHLTTEKLEIQILSLIKKNLLGDARIRITVTRAEGELFQPANNAQYFIETVPLPSDAGMLNENGLQLCLYPDAKKICDAFSNLKHNNFLPYAMGAIFAKQHKCNDAIILNQYNRICDTCIANIFIIKDEIIYTPSLTEGCIAGTTRKFLIQHCQDFTVKDEPITTEFLFDADEVFTCNSIYTMRWVAAIGEKEYTNSITREIAQKLLQTKTEDFCF